MPSSLQLETCIFLTNTGKYNCPSTQPSMTSLPTEDILRGNLKRIQANTFLNSSRLIQPHEDIELNDVFLEISMTRNKS